MTFDQVSKLIQDLHYRFRDISPILPHSIIRMEISLDKFEWENFVNTLNTHNTHMGYETSKLDSKNQNSVDFPSFISHNVITIKLKDI